MWTLGPKQDKRWTSGPWAGKLTPFRSLSGREWGRLQAWGRLGRLDSVSRTVLEVSEGAAGQGGPVAVGENHPSGRGTNHVTLSLRNVRVSFKEGIDQLPQTTAFPKQEPERKEFGGETA